MVRPLLDEGYDSLEFEYDETVTQKFTENDAVDIVGIDFDLTVEFGEEQEEEPQEFTALLKIYSPVFDPDKPKWKFDIGGGNIQSVDISETDIAVDALKKGNVSVNDIYKVTLELTQSITKNNQIRNHYKVKKVIKFITGKQSSQRGLFTDDS